MWGAIIGDFVGSIYEVQPIRTKTFPLLQTHCTITDDSVLSVAVADALLNARGYTEALQDWGNRYPTTPDTEDCFGSGWGLRIRSPTAVTETDQPCESPRWVGCGTPNRQC